MIVSHTMFMWLCTVMVAGVSGAWLIYDLVLLVRYLPRGQAARDQIFGSVMGITIGVLGVGGAIWLHVSGIPEPTHCLPQCAGLYFNGVL